MSTVMICLAIATALPFMIAFGSLPYRLKQFGKPDLNAPRAQAAQLEGAGHRIVAAQNNAWEALMLYVATLFMATTAGVDESALATGSLIFIAARIVHPVFYVAGIQPLRTLSWLVAAGACAWMIAKAFSVG